MHSYLVPSPTTATHHLNDRSSFVTRLDFNIATISGGDMMPYESNTILLFQCLHLFHLKERVPVIRLSPSDQGCRTVPAVEVLCILRFNSGARARFHQGQFLLL